MGNSGKTRCFSVLRTGNDLSPERLRHLLTYDQDTGAFVWREARGGRAKAGSIAGNQNGAGYIDIRIDGRAHQAHRLAFLYVTGAWPPAQVDHVNRCKWDNRWANLRLATHAQNMRNRGDRRVASGGVLGVAFRPSTGKWTARICVDGRVRHIGAFPSSACG